MAVKKQVKKSASRGKAASARKGGSSSKQGVNKMKVSSLKTYKERRKTIPSINPYTEEVMMDVALMNRDEISEQLEKTRAAFRSWKEIPVSDRASFIRKLGDHLRVRSGNTRN